MSATQPGPEVLRIFDNSKEAICDEDWQKVQQYFFLRAAFGYTHNKTKEGKTIQLPPVGEERAEELANEMVKKLLGNKKLWTLPPGEDRHRYINGIWPKVRIKELDHHQRDRGGFRKRKGHQASAEPRQDPSFEEDWCPAGEEDPTLREEELPEPSSEKPVIHKGVLQEEDPLGDRLPEEKEGLSLDEGGELTPAGQTARKRSQQVLQEHLQQERENLRQECLKKLWQAFERIREQAGGTLRKQLDALRDYLLGYSVEKIAARENVPVGTVRSWICRAGKFLRQKLGPMGF